MMDIDALAPGRRLDALVAEKVMGLNVRGWAWAYVDEMSCWNFEHVGDTESRATEEDLCAVYAPDRMETEYFGPTVKERWPDGIPQWAIESDEQSRRDWDRDVKAWGTYRGMLEAVPEFSTSIAPAWKAVEKLPANLDFYVSREEGRYVTHITRRECGCGGSTKELAFEMAETAPHAICLATLKALEDTP